MQTFLPFPSFADSAAVLDRQRLGKQRVETLQIMRALLEKTGWANHPATRMWRGYEAHLLAYQYAVCNEWTSRGYADTCLSKTTILVAPFMASPFHWEPPPWIGDPAFHLAHQSNLLRKDLAHYGPHFPDVPDDLPYVWPTP